VALDADLSEIKHTTHFFAKEFPERFRGMRNCRSQMIAIGAGFGVQRQDSIPQPASPVRHQQRIRTAPGCGGIPNVNLKVVGTHSGISIGEDGPSQMSIEDLAGVFASRLYRAVAGRRGLDARLVFAAAAHIGPVFFAPDGPRQLSCMQPITF